MFQECSCWDEWQIYAQMGLQYLGVLRFGREVRFERGRGRRVKGRMMVVLTEGPDQRVVWLLKRGITRQRNGPGRRRGRTAPGKSAATLTRVLGILHNVLCTGPSNKTRDPRRLCQEMKAIINGWHFSFRGSTKCRVKINLCPSLKWTSVTFSCYYVLCWRQLKRWCYSARRVIRTGQFNVFVHSI